VFAHTWRGDTRDVLRVALLAIAACGTTSVPPLRPSGPSVEPVNVCVTAYAEYELRWRAALEEEISDATEGSIEPSEIAEIVESQVDTLPNREEIEELRSVYGIVDLLIPDAAWPTAFGAAERAIASCGESAPRPTSR
jgi:hypothetical protein